jgi:hypothetical protein
VREIHPLVRVSCVNVVCFKHRDQVQGTRVSFHAPIRSRGLIPCNKHNRTWNQAPNRTSVCCHNILSAAVMERQAE